MSNETLRALLNTNLRILTFRAAREEFLALGWPHLYWGLVWTGLVGMGRYWDNPKAILFQHLGAGSLVYVFILAAFLWLVIRPLQPKNWSYFNLLTFITLASAPAALYAIPVEMFMSKVGARSANAWFLGIVSAWRLSLLIFYLRRMAGLTWPRIITGSLLPMAVIVAALTLLNLEHVVFNIMGGFSGGPNDGAYLVLLVITVISFYAFPLLAVAYLGLIVRALRKKGHTGHEASYRSIEPPSLPD